MARRRGLDKFAAPEPEPAPETQAGAEQPVAAKVEEKPFEEERLMLFGPPATQKTILVFIIVGLLFSGLLYFLSPPAPQNADKGLRVVPMIFVMVHGALLGMLLGQLFLVYADRIIVLFTLMGVVIGEAIFCAVKYNDHPFVYHRVAMGMLLGVFFWSGFVGFWIGFIDRKSVV